MSYNRKCSPERAWLLSAFTAGALVACGADPSRSADDDEAVGLARVRLESAPAGVSCFRVTANGPSRSVTANFDVQPGASSRQFMLQRLPLGNVGFQGAAYGVACSAVTDSTVPDWISDVVTAPVLRGAIADVLLLMRRNGRANVAANFADAEVCLAQSQPCVGDDDCCSGRCQSGACASACTPMDVALNTVGSGSPNPLESDPGWGGGAQPWEILQGHTSYTDTWAHGLAFTGGTGSWNGQACGMRQATIDFGSLVRFNRVMTWHHGAEHVPNAYHIEYWDGSAWLNAGGTSSHRSDLADYPTNGWGSEPTESIFPAVTASKVRFVIDSNCDITHGWLYSLQVYSSCE